MNYNENYNVGGIEAVNRTMSRGLVTRLYKNISTGNIVALSMELVTKDVLTGFDTGDYLSPTFAKVNVYHTSGTYDDMVSTDQEVKANELSFTLREDFNTLADDYVAGEERNYLTALMLGNSIIINGDTYVCVGTNGIMKRNTKTAARDQEKDWQYLVYREGNFVRIPNTYDHTTGGKKLKKNTYKQVIDLEQPTFIYEHAVSKGAKTEVMFIPLVYTTSNTKDEADINTISFPSMKVCDVHNKKDFLFDTVTTEFAITDTGITELEVDYIVQNATGAKPTDFGTDKEVALVINSANGSMAVYTTNGTDAWTQDTTGRFLQGARILSKKLTADKVAVGTEADKAKEGSYIVAVKTAVTNAFGGTAANFNDGGTANYVLSNLTWNRAMTAFENRVEE